MNLRVLRCGPSLMQTLALVILIAAVLPFALRDKQPDPDLWWHLRAGQSIVENHSVPRVDNFSSTALGRPWVDHEWALEPLLYAVFQKSGYEGLVRISGLMVALTAGVLLALAYLLTGELLLSTVLVAVVLRPMERYLVPRPQVISYLLFSVLLLLLVRARNDRRAVRWLWCAPSLMLLWANCHGAFPMGLVLLALHWIAEEREVFGRARSTPCVLRNTLRAVLPASIVACLANPYGCQLFLAPFRHVTSPMLRSAINEWAPPDLADPRHVMAVAVGLLFLIATLASLSTRRRPADVCLALLVTAMMLSSRRHIPFFLIGIVPVGAPSFRQLLHQIISSPSRTVRRSGRRARRHQAPVTRGPGWNVMNRLAVLRSPLLWLPPALVLTWLIGSPAMFGSAVRRERFPVRAADFLAARDLPGNILNPFDWGGYLIYRLWPHTRVFIDGRFPAVHDEQTFRDYRTLSHADPGWERLIERYDLRLLVCSALQQGLIEAVWASPRWRLVYHDEQAAIFQRTDQPEVLPSAQIVARLGDGSGETSAEREFVHEAHAERGPVRRPPVVHRVQGFGAPGRPFQAVTAGVLTDAPVTSPGAPLVSGVSR